MSKTIILADFNRARSKASLSEHVEKYIRENYNVSTVDDIADHLGLSNNQVINIACSLGFKANKGSLRKSNGVKFNVHEKNWLI